MPPNTPLNSSLNKSLDKSLVDTSLENNASTHTINSEVKCLYDPKDERAACGVGFIVNIDGIASHKVILI